MTGHGAGYDRYDMQMLAIQIALTERKPEETKKQVKSYE